MITHPYNVTHLELLVNIKGRVNPKMNLLLSFTHPFVIPNLYRMFIVCIYLYLLWSIKEDILKNGFYPYNDNQWVFVYNIRTFCTFECMLKYKLWTEIQ